MPLKFKAYPGHYPIHVNRPTHSLNEGSTVEVAEGALHGPYVCATGPNEVARKIGHIASQRRQLFGTQRPQGIYLKSK